MFKVYFFWEHLTGVSVGGLLIPEISDLWLSWLSVNQYQLINGSFSTLGSINICSNPSQAVSSISLCLLMSQPLLSCSPRVYSQPLASQSLCMVRLKSVLFHLLEMDIPKDILVRFEARHILVVVVVQDPEPISISLIYCLFASHPTESWQMGCKLRAMLRLATSALA